MPHDEDHEAFPAFPPPEATAYFEAKGVKVGFAYQDVWKEEHVASFTVAKAMKEDILEKIQGATTKAIALGTTARTFSNELRPMLEAAGWWGRREVLDPLTGNLVKAQLGSPSRLKLIYDTNMRVAHAAGQWQRAQRTKSTHPFFIYTLGPSIIHRELHVRWDGTILPVDDPWWNAHTPPNGYNCRCRLRTVSRRRVEKKGGPTERPSSHLVAWKDKRTGRVESLPVGIEPGWDFNPGKERMKGLGGGA